MSFASTKENQPQIELHRFTRDEYDELARGAIKKLTLKVSDMLL